MDWYWIALIGVAVWLVLSYVLYSLARGLVSSPPPFNIKHFMYTLLGVAIVGGIIVLVVGLVISSIQGLIRVFT